jgi:hypothetical protein
MFCRRLLMKTGHRIFSVALGVKQGEPACECPVICGNDFQTVDLLRSVDMIHSKYETGASDYAY